jgi:hypothetical protein
VLRLWWLNRCLKVVTSWDGGAIVYSEGKAETTSIILELEERLMPRFHCHPVPGLTPHTAEHI